ncbi:MULTISPECIES: 2-isopropylmalate synthase [Pseudomonas]|jgi:2-isopropylmalate synthase|uniref:2-isopropylmalate synthase n=1 Tax=Pseudomonas TaxID=286 RepID=UPI0005B97687|nr:MULTISPECIES: 2-isopropylmalate synthase [Pseudomonas]KWR81130.1 2-isopropylmalate synthase [Pseudomonas sp. PI1]WAB91212.1 2-isopropylmalate synthase [Pseudomonas citronellolis]
MQANPQTKYRPFPAIDLPNRRWPSQTIVQAPVWLSTDLRDGNQALFEPMNRERKLRLFAELVRLGFKEIEVGFPAASRTDFAIIRQLIDEGGIPDDVTPMVMTQLREDLIDETVRAVAGARRVIVHLYNAIAPVWRRVVFGLSVDEVEQLVVRHVQLLKEKVAAHPQTEWVLQYSPETFCMAELEVSLRMCNAAIRTWDAGPGRPIIVNLPTTVEVATPNVFADQIEWMHQRLEHREHVVLSVHPHNDRGTGVACAEQALLAGAQRVEGCLFGNGERSGNLDLVTLALNLYTQGIHPGLDFSDIAGVARVAEACTGLPIHPRHPYVGDLVFTAFSGSHQDAIAKGFAAQAADGFWEVPYLPIDPRDLGRTYDSIVRVNSQSGKGGIAYLLQRDHGVVMPRRMQVEFSAIVQRQADSSETELSSEALWQLFAQTYLAPARPGGALAYVGHRLFEAEGGQGIVLEVELADGRRRQLQGVGNGPIDAAVAALGLPIRIDGYEERSLGGGADAQALALVEVAWPGEPGTRFGAGCHANIVSASIQAVLCAVSRFAGGRVVPGGFL